MDVSKIFLFLFLFLGCAAPKKGIQYLYIKSNQSIPEARNIIEYQLGYKIVKIDTVIRIHYMVFDSLNSLK